MYPREAGSSISVRIHVRFCVQANCDKLGGIASHRLGWKRTLNRAKLYAGFVTAARTSAYGVTSLIKVVLTNTSCDRSHIIPVMRGRYSTIDTI
jgi:hypothetical protein